MGPIGPAASEALCRQIRAWTWTCWPGSTKARDRQGDIRAGRSRGPAAGLPPDAAANRFPPQEIRRRGSQALAAGEVGVILVAGGQGTRLGFDHPKGMYPIGPVSGRSLFQIHVEKILAVGRRHGVRIRST